ncbi:N-acetyltransferase, partial [candidate division TA06 bacterium]|nr:N-acetyltransferase [candidate division TA06 bacterium]
EGAGGMKIWHYTHIMKGARIGKNCIIGQNCFVGSRAILGNGVKLQNNVSIYDLITLEDFVFVGPSVVFTNDVNPRAAYPKGGKWIPSHVKRGASIGANATLLCGLTIGAHAFIGAGAVVTKDVPDYSIFAGVPARFIGWMCECGEKLKFNSQKGNEKTTCQKCKRKYENQRDIVKEVRER